MTKTGATDRAIQLYGDADKDCALCFKHGVSLTEPLNLKEPTAEPYLNFIPATLIIKEHRGIGYTTKVGTYKIKNG